MDPWSTQMTRQRLSQAYTPSHHKGIPCDMKNTNDNLLTTLHSLYYVRVSFLTLNIFRVKLFVNIFSDYLGLLKYYFLI